RGHASRAARRRGSGPRASARRAPRSRERRDARQAPPFEDTSGEVVPEATLEDGVPRTDGWFVVNARDARWQYNEMGWYCNFEGDDGVGFEQLGINLNVLPPGSPMAMYHEEPGQEDFLVLRGECVLIVEGE